MKEKNLKEMSNKVTLQGTLLSNSIEIKTDKKGKRYISGEVEVMVNPECAIPVSTFSYEFRSNGEKNSIYERLSKLVGVPSAKEIGVQKAPKISISNAKIENNNFFSERDNKVVTNWRINTIFARSAATDAQSIDNFEVEGIVSSIKEVINREGESTGDYDIKLLNVGFGNRVNELTFRFNEPTAVDYINNHYEIGTLVTLYGEIIYDQTDKKVLESTGFGEPVERVYTNTVRLLKINAGKEPVSPEESGYNIKELQTILAKQNNEIQEKYNARTQAQLTATKVANNDLLF